MLELKRIAYIVGILLGQCDSDGIGDVHPGGLVRCPARHRAALSDAGTAGADVEGGHDVDALIPIGARVVAAGGRCEHQLPVGEGGEVLADLAEKALHLVGLVFAAGQRATVGASRVAGDDLPECVDGREPVVGEKIPLASGRVAADVMVRRDDVGVPIPGIIALRRGVDHRVVGNGPGFKNAAAKSAEDALAGFGQNFVRKF